MTAVIPTGVVPDRIRTLAQFLLDKKKAGNRNKYVLMLGAGASLSSGVKLAQTIIEEIVR